MTLARRLITLVATALTLGLFVASIASCDRSAPAPAAATVGVAELIDVSGKATVTKAGAAETQAAAAGQRLDAGDSVRVHEGTVRIRYDQDGTLQDVRAEALIEIRGDLTKP